MDRILIVSSTETKEKWDALLENMNLNNYIKENNIVITFCNDKEKIDDYLSDSSLLVTDYSNIYMEFVKKSKPVIFYQNEKQDRSLALFGKILADEEDVVNRIIGYANMNYRVENIYLKKIDKYFKENNIVYN